MNEIRYRFVTVHLTKAEGERAKQGKIDQLLKELREAMDEPPPTTAQRTEEMRPDHPNYNDSLYWKYVRDSFDFKMPTPAESSEAMVQSVNNLKP